MDSNTAVIAVRIGHPTEHVDRFGMTCAVMTRAIAAYVLAK